MFKCTEGNGLASFGLDWEQYRLRASLRSPAHLSPPTFLHIISLVLLQSLHPAAHHLPVQPQFSMQNLQCAWKLLHRTKSHRMHMCCSTAWSMFESSLNLSTLSTLALDSTSPASVTLAVKYAWDLPVLITGTSSQKRWFVAGKKHQQHQ